MYPLKGRQQKSTSHNISKSVDQISLNAYFKSLQQQVVFSEKQLDNYLHDNANEQTCMEIENDPDYLEWISQKEKS